MQLKEGIQECKFAYHTTMKRDKGKGEDRGVSVRENLKGDTLIKLQKMIEELLDSDDTRSPKTLFSTLATLQKVQNTTIQWRISN